MLLLTGVSAVALGVVVLVWPGKTLFVAGVLFGIYLVVSGIGYMFAAFGSHAGAAMRVLTFVGGAISVGARALLLPRRIRGGHAFGHLGRH